ncbi:MAG: DUF1461 domain-containing protein [Eubacteriales bacterium]|nr:DUF1461 domain-containing protein [Eubacteriales bacterium]
MNLPEQIRNATWAAGLIFLLILVGFTARAFLMPAFSAETLAEGFARFGDFHAAGVSEEELPQIADGIAGFLRGDRDTPQVEVTRHGETQAAFSQRELEHMPDVKRLADWAGLLWRFGLGLAALLAVLVIRSPFIKDPDLFKLMGKSLLGAATAFLLLSAGLVIWAVRDFTGLFYQLHLWLFPNELWQLNPAEHLMIQLMPEMFFVDYALSSIRRMAWLLLAFPLGAGLWLFPRRRAG